jgi:hypothetical protein
VALDVQTPRGRRLTRAAAAQAAGDLAGAEALYWELAQVPVDAAMQEEARYHLAVLAEQRGDYHAAAALYSSVEASKAETLGPRRPPDQLLLRVRMGMVNLLDEQGDADEAAALCREVAEAQAQTLGGNHPDTLRSQMNLAGFLAGAGKLRAAEEMMRDVERRQASFLGPGHPDVLLTRYNLAVQLAEGGQQVAAERLCREVAEAQAMSLGRDHPAVRATRKNLAELTGSGEFIVLPPPPPPPPAMAHGRLVVSVLAAEKLRGTRARIQKTKPKQWAADTAGGDALAVPSEQCQPYIVVLAGGGGMAKRTPVAASLGRKPQWGAGAVVVFELPEPPAFLRLCCFDELHDELHTERGGAAGSPTLGQRYDMDAPVGVGELPAAEGGAYYALHPLALKEWVPLLWPAVVDCWSAPGEEEPFFAESVPAGRVCVSVTWEPKT